MTDLNIERCREGLPEYTQGICEDGAAILVDGIRMPVDLIVSTLNRLTATNEKLRAENERLSQCLRWQQDRDATISTHSDDCWQWGNRHYECALRELEQLRTENAEQACRMGLMREWMGKQHSWQTQTPWGVFIAFNPEAGSWFEPKTASEDKT